MSDTNDQESLDELVRDACSVVPVPKSEYRRRLLAWRDQECKRREVKANLAKKIALVKKDIRYATLKARYQRIFLGGEKDALKTKRYKRKLVKRLAHLKSLQSAETEE